MILDTVFLKIWLYGVNKRILCFYFLRELADTGFVSVQNFVKLGLYLKKWYDKQQASWEVQILKFRNWICLRKLHRSGLDLLPFFQVLPSSAMVFTLIFRNSCSQNLRSFANILPKLDFTKFWRNTKCLCAETLNALYMPKKDGRLPASYYRHTCFLIYDFSAVVCLRGLCPTRKVCRPRRQATAEKS